MTKDEARSFLSLIGKTRSDEEMLLAFVRRAVMLEREACAQIAESDAQAYGEENPQSAAAADEVARQIRARP